LVVPAKHAWFSLCVSIVLLVSQPQTASAKGLFDFLSGKPALKDTKDPTYTENAHDFISCKILIKAPVDVVWQTVHVERDLAPNLVYNKLLQAHENQSVFEQKWAVFPFLARTTCVMDETDFPPTRIDFKLLKSDEFKSLEGKWLLTAADDGSSTLLELKAHLELRRRFGPKTLISALAKHRMNKRLEHVKELAEQSRTEMKVNATVL
jgi:hypothetical protein